MDKYCYCARKDEIVLEYVFQSCHICNNKYIFRCLTNDMIDYDNVGTRYQKEIEYEKSMQKLVQHKLREKKLKRILK